MCQSETQLACKHMTYHFYATARSSAFEWNHLLSDDEQLQDVHLLVFHNMATTTDQYRQ